MVVRLCVFHWAFNNLWISGKRSIFKCRPHYACVHSFMRSDVCVCMSVPLFSAYLMPPVCSSICMYAYVSVNTHVEMLHPMQNGCYVYTLCISSGVVHIIHCMCCVCVWIVRVLVFSFTSPTSPSPSASTADFQCVSHIPIRTSISFYICSAPNTLRFGTAYATKDSVACSTRILIDSFR